MGPRGKTPGQGFWGPGIQGFQSRGRRVVFTVEGQKVPWQSTDLEQVTHSHMVHTGRGKALFAEGLAGDRLVWWKSLGPWACMQPA